jgi:hypothetical protein
MSNEEAIKEILKMKNLQDLFTRQDGVHAVIKELGEIIQAQNQVITQLVKQQTEERQDAMQLFMQAMQPFFAQMGTLVGDGIAQTLSKQQADSAPKKPKDVPVWAPPKPPTRTPATDPGIVKQLDKTGTTSGKPKDS